MMPALGTFRMMLGAFALGGFLLACAIVRWLGVGQRGQHAAVGKGAPDGELELAPLLETVATTGTVTLGVWVATSWALALAGHLSAVGLAVAAGAECAIGVVFFVRLARSGGLPRERIRAPSAATAVAIAVALTPVVLWTAFVAWRGTFLPVYNHDALAYHLPKAVLLAHAGGFHVFDVPEARVATWPCDYELLLADTLLATGGDASTATIANLAFALFVLVTAWVAAEWWGPGPHVALAAAVVGTAPLVVLHSGLHKNDLLVAVFAVTALVWAARWAVRGDRAALALATGAVLLLAGTKASAVFVGAVAALILFGGALRHRRELRARGIALYAAGAFAGAVLLGGVTYLANAVVLHTVVAAPPGQGQYGDWFTIVQYTAMLVLAPFSPSPATVWNPFRGEAWWWPANDVWQSHFGPLVSVLILGLVPCVWRYRRAGPGGDAIAAERATVGVAALVAYVATLPVRWRPIGFFGIDGRYVLFVLPVIVGWTLCPLAIELFAAARRWGAVLGAAAPVVAAAGVAFLGVRALWEYGVHDAYAPIEWVEYELDHPDDRRPLVRRAERPAPSTRSPAPTTCARSTSATTPGSIRRTARASGARWSS
jgi:hypothetical protein